MPTFYRSLKRLPPTERDFLPHGKLGIPPRPRSTAAQLDSFLNGVSVYDDEAAAWINARRANLGDYLAVLQIDEASSVNWIQTGGNPHHFDLRGDPATMLAAVIRIVSRSGDER